LGFVSHTVLCVFVINFFWVFFVRGLIVEKKKR